MTNKERKATQRRVYHQTWQKLNRNNGHSPDHKLGRVNYWALLHGKYIKVNCPTATQYNRMIREGNHHAIGLE